MREKAAKRKSFVMDVRGRTSQWMFTVHSGSVAE
jgi:hypothetical protein